MARGQVQHAPGGGIVEEHAFGPNRYEIDELAAVFQRVRRARVQNSASLGTVRSSIIHLRARTRLRCRSAAPSSLAPAARLSRLCRSRRLCGNPDWVVSGERPVESATRGRWRLSKPTAAVCFPRSQCRPMPHTCRSP